LLISFSISFCAWKLLIGHWTHGSERNNRKRYGMTFKAGSHSTKQVCL
jgi:hypothetical protein